MNQRLINWLRTHNLRFRPGRVGHCRAWPGFATAALKSVAPQPLPLSWNPADSSLLQAFLCRIPDTGRYRGRSSSADVLLEAAGVAAIFVDRQWGILQNLEI